jgi:hypothetical protein
MPNSGESGPDAASAARQLASRLEEICGKRDPRLAEWQDLCAETDG